MVKSLKAGGQSFDLQLQLWPQWFRYVLPDSATNDDQNNYKWSWLGQVHMYESYRLYSYLASTLERQKRHIAIVDLQVTFVHGVVAHCNRIYSQCYYLQVQVMYLDELYGKCSGTAHSCTNSGYQALLSDFCQAPGNEAMQLQDIYTSKRVQKFKTVWGHFPCWEVKGLVYEHKG